jgi:hypothetical protein
MARHLYYRGDREISEHEALDRNGMLKDGVSLRVRTQMRDAATDARARAYELYDQEIEQRYKHGTVRDVDPTWSAANPKGRSFESTGFGERGTPRGQAEGDSCTINGAEGRLRLVGGQLQCVPLRSSSDSAAKFTDGTPDGGGNRPGWRIRIGDNRQAVRDALRDYENDLVNRWRGPNAPCPSCQGTGEARRQSS